MGSPLYYGYREDCKVFLESLVIELAIFKASSAIDLTFPLSRSHSGLLQVERKWIHLRPVFLNVFVGSFPATTITTNCTNSASERSESFYFFVIFSLFIFSLIPSIQLFHPIMMQGSCRIE